MGGAAFAGGDDDTEVNINTYSIGANLTYYVNTRTAIEGELGIGLGLAAQINAARLLAERPRLHEDDRSCIDCQSHGNVRPHQMT